jgi:hypothetical protein
MSLENTLWGAPHIHGELLKLGFTVAQSTVALVIVRLTRRELVWINVTAHPTADWIAQQITEAFRWDEAPRYLIRDRDAVYGAVVTAACAPWAFAISQSRPVRRGRTALRND